ncbi:hypothetical protein ACTNEW_02085 [Blautia sp. HCP3S3_G3]
MREIIADIEKKSQKYSKTCNRKKVGDMTKAIGSREKQQERSGMA